ncbi:MAG: hypothetical protein DDT19_00220 [Syntrophomonadaceae bacterium]|nr:hypothetical protein [Bacillota bacterium]
MNIKALLEELKGIASEKEATTEELAKVLLKIASPQGEDWGVLTVRDGEGNYLGDIRYGWNNDDRCYYVNYLSSFSSKDVIASVIRRLQERITTLSETVAKRNRLVRSLRGTLKNS